MSSIDRTVIPEDWRPVIALSRPEPGPFYPDFDLLNTALSRTLGNGFGSSLSSKWCALTASL